MFSSCSYGPCHQGRSLSPRSKKVGAIQLFSWLKYLAPDASGYTTVNSALLDVLGLVEETCKAHEDVWDNTDEEPRDYIDGYLKYNLLFINCVSLLVAKCDNFSKTGRSSWQTTAWSPSPASWAGGATRT